MSKPIGPICNLDCAYCYYSQKKALYPGTKSWRMTDRTLDLYIRQYVEAQPVALDEIVFGWQGGEPTLLGIDFFRRAVDIQRKHTPPGKRIGNTLQTNGMLLNDAWCEFLRENNFLVGISIDGPAELHDEYRHDKQGRPTHYQVLQAQKRLRKRGVEYNALVVVSRHNGDHPLEVYRFLRNQGINFIQFIPLVERPGTKASPQSESSALTLGESPTDLVTERSVGACQFGEFLIAVFDEWLCRDVGRIFVQIFDEALAAWLGQPLSLCVFRKHCGRALAIEHNGDLYSCDHFVEPAYKLGNIHELPIVELANSEQQQQFARDKETSLPEYCRRCDMRFVCNGECPKNRFLRTPDGESGLNYLCEGYHRFFRHIDPVMKEMAEELRHGRPAMNVMYRRNAATRSPKRQRGPRSGKIGRNDPCPCESGRKYKQCCMRRARLRPRPR